MRNASTQTTRNVLTSGSGPHRSLAGDSDRHPSAFDPATDPFIASLLACIVQTDDIEELLPTRNESLVNAASDRRDALTRLYTTLEQFILNSEPPVVTERFTTDTLRNRIRGTAPIAKADPSLFYFLLPLETQAAYLMGIFIDDMTSDVATLLGPSAVQRAYRSVSFSTETTKQIWSEGTFNIEAFNRALLAETLSFDSPKAMTTKFRQLYEALCFQATRLFGDVIVSNTSHKSYLTVLRRYGSTAAAVVLQEMPAGLLEEEKHQSFSAHELIRKNVELAEKTKESERLNQDLEWAKLATLNLLEDLNREKEAVEEKIKERTRELQTEKSKLDIVTEEMVSGTMLLDNDGQVIFANRKLRDLLGFREVDNAELKDRFLQRFSDTRVGKKIEQCVLQQSLGSIPEVDLDGNVYSLLVKPVNPHAKETDQLSGSIVFLRDVTEEKLLERSKTELVAVASHQLRTPLTAIRGNVEMLVDESYGTLNDEQRELLSDVEVSTIRLITMVNDMLDITKIEEKTLELDRVETDIPQVVRSIIEDLEAYAARHEFTVVHHEPDEPLFAFVDEVRIRQVLQNLIDNAIKYSRHPGTLDISYKADDNASLTIQLADNGIGIPKAEQGRLFGRFYRASNTARVGSSGSGLGLYIVKSIVESHGGSISFTSEKNEGSTFTVTLPRSADHS